MKGAYDLAVIYIIQKNMTGLLFMIFGILAVPILVIVIISLYFTNRNKIKKAEFFIIQKHEEGKITRDDGNTLLSILESDKRLNTINVKFQQRMFPQEKTDIININQPVIQNTSIDISQADEHNYPGVQKKQYEPPVPSEPINGGNRKKDVNSANILLIMGVLLILISGLIFATTTWNYLDDIVRTAIVAAASLVFYLGYVFAEQKLKLTRTAIAFYCLGSIFLPITVFTAGYFKLLGDYVSLDGDGDKLLWAMILLPVFLTASFAAKKYLYNFFLWIGFSSVTLIVGFLLRSFISDKDIFVLALTIYSGVSLLIIEILLRKTIAVTDFQKIVFLNLPLYSILNISIIGVIGLVFSSASIISFGSIILFAGLILRKTYETKANAYGAYIFSFVLLFGFSRINAGEQFDNRILLLAFCSSIIYVLGYLGFFSDAVKKALNLSAVVLICLTYLVNFGYTVAVGGETTVLTLITLVVLLANIIFMTFKTKSKIAIAIIPFILLSIINAVDSLFRPVGLNSGIFKPVLILLSFLILYFIDSGKLVIKLRSKVSDLIFTAGCVYWCIWSLFDTASSISEYGALMGLVVLLIIVAMVVVDSGNKINSAVACYLSPGIMLLAIPVLNLFIGSLAGSALIIYCALSFLGLVFLFNKKRGRQFEKLDFAFMISHFLFVIPFSMFCFGEYAFIITVLFSMSCLARFIINADSKIGNVLQIDMRKLFMWLFGIGFSSALFLFLYEKIPGIDMFYILSTTLALPMVAFVICIALRNTKSDSIKKHIVNIQNYCIIMSNISFVLMAASYFFDDGSLYIKSMILFVAIGYCISSAYYLKIFEISFLQIILIYPVMYKLIRFAFTEEYTYLFTGTIIMFILFFLASRIIGKSAKQLWLPGVDWFKVLNVIAPFYILSTLPVDYRIGGFALLGIYILLFYNRKNRHIVNDSILTIGSFFFCPALWSQTFIELPSQFATVINLIPSSVYVFLVYKFLWREQKIISNRLSLLYFAVVVTTLSIESILYEYLYNAIIVGVIALAGIIISYVFRKKSWFAISIVTLIGLSIYMSRSFWASLAWWVYLLSVGIILIAIAATNEIIKQKKIHNDFKPFNLFKDWNW